jgi:SAM-dependent methyltransferase
VIETIEHKGEEYPLYEASGNASRFIMPFAKEVLSGIVYDIGYSKEEWKFPGAIGIEPSIDDRFDAHNLPETMVDGIFSSHCLEHVPRWVDALDHWGTRLKKGGVLFLYLPAFTQTYWRPWSNRKHVNIFTPEIIREYLYDNGYTKIFQSGIDLNHSFATMAEKL